MFDPFGQGGWPEPCVARRDERELLHPSSVIASLRIRVDGALVARDREISPDYLVERRLLRPCDLDGSVERRRRTTVFEPISPVPPMTTIFMAFLPMLDPS